MINRYEDACNSIALEFGKRLGLTFDYWVGDRIGEIAQFGDYYVNNNDMYYLIKNNIDKDKFFEWYDYSLGNFGRYNFENWLKK